MRRALLLLSTLGLLLLVAAPAAAQSISDIEDELRADGVFVEEGAEGSQTELRRSVADARDAGITLYVVSMRGSSTDAESLADSLRDRIGGTVLVVTPESLGASSASLSQTDLDRGLDAFSGTVDAGTVSFVEAIAGSTGAGNSGDSTTAGGSGGSGWSFLIVLLVIVGLIVAVVVFVRSRNRRRVTDELSARRRAVAEELAAVGQEILALADRVALADNTAATNHFRQGNEQYLELQEELEEATSLWQVTEVDYAADTAAWHLDATEALLDGDEVPEEPARPDLEVSRPPAKDPTPALESAPSRRVEPRQRRRTQWDPPSTRGGGFGDLLTGILVGDVLRGGGRSGRRAPGRWSGGGSLGGGGRSRGGFGGSSGSRSRGSSASRRR